MCHLHDPSSRFRTGVLNLMFAFFAAAAHMRRVRPLPYLVLGIGANISGIGTQMLDSFFRIRAFNFHRIERLLQ